MLSLVWLPEQSAQRVLWNGFDPSFQTWIVNDRKTKFFMNQSLLDKHLIISDPVKKAKEFWKDLLRVADPEMRVLEDLGVRVQAKDFLLTAGKSEWCRRPHAPEKLMDACQSMSSLLTHSLADEFLRDFENDFKKGGGPFLELAHLGIEFYKRCRDRKRMPRCFLPFYLSQSPHVLLSERSLIFDLGFELGDGERELIQFLSRTNDVKVLIPAKDSDELEEKGLYQYRSFELGLSEVQNVKIVPKEGKQTPLELWRCSSPEAEARKATEMVADWVKKGISPDRICIAAERFSNYENILSHDLEWEGIGLHRGLQTVLSASRLFRALNARLLIVKGTMKASVFEEAFLSVSFYRMSPRRCQERRVLKPILQASQIPDPDLRQKILSLSQKRKGSYSVIAFESLVIEIFKELVKEASLYEDPLEAQQRNELFLNALGRLRGEVGDQDLDLNQWIEAWQEVANSVHLPIRQPVEGGIWGVDLSSVEETPAEYLIILGAVESSTRFSPVTGLGSEKLRVLSERGFELSAKIKKKTDPLMQWLLTGDRKHIVLSCPRTDSSGKSVAANPLWLKFAARQGKDLDQLDFAKSTVWTDVQKSILNPAISSQVDRFKNWTPGTAELKGLSVKEELEGIRRIQLPEQLGKPLPMRMSASRIEAYWECPFKFFARSYLGLFDEADLEIEPSPQKKGQWLHSAAELILKEGRPLVSWTDEELIKLVDDLDQVQKQVSSDIWSSVRSRFVRQLRRFIDFEIKWQKEYPRTKPVDLEAALEGFICWDQENLSIKFRSDKPESTVENWTSFRGSIDRIDVTPSGQAIILDYKSGAAAASNIPGWPKTGTFQLALYSEAVEAGLHKNQPRKVIAAQYYQLKSLNREKGFKLVDQDLMGILPRDKSRGDVEGATREKYFSEIDKQVHEILEKIRKGEMTPHPHSEKICSSCSWRTSCRAPHLS